MELLDKPPVERIHYFNDYTVAHPFFLVAYKTLLQRIHNPSTKSIFLVYGPSGVGKSTLIKKVAEKIINDLMDQIISNPGFIPVTGIEARAPDKGYYDWRDHYIRSLLALKEPLVEHKVDIKKKPDIEIKVNDVNRKLRSSLETALKYRETLAFFIDEAQHISFNSSSKSSNNQMNMIKSLASTTKTPHILFGTYEILDFRDSLGQLSRRGLDIHLRRYDIQKSNEQKMFIQTLWNIQRQIPIQIEPELIEHWEYFYQVSLGCIGILKDLISTTLEYKLLENPDASELTLGDFKEYALTPNQAFKLAQEALDGEANVKVNNRSRDDVLNLLLGNNSNTDEEEEIATDEEKVQENKTKKKRKVGERNPKRDAVGE
ncbi:ATP-binding protein [Metabacillus litoralis]|uniref:ATP-binding protein n=1 Tax=Metabacillus litoralis TaxID=152268 RepID=UPI001CFF1213|nr:ATP-binding protein [Metabacillus litoralis]